MRFLAKPILTAILAASAFGPAQACVMMADFEAEDVQYADAVVIGRIQNYEIVKDPKKHEEHEAFRRKHPEIFKDVKSSGRLLSDYARFEIRVDEVLRGNVYEVIRATWDNSTFGEPTQMPTGPYLIALRKDGSPLPPLRGPSATLLPDPEPGRFKVLQAPCAKAFILEHDSQYAVEVRSLLSASGK